MKSSRVRGEGSPVFSLKKKKKNNKVKNKKGLNGRHGKGEEDNTNKQGRVIEGAASEEQHGRGSERKKNVKEKGKSTKKQNMGNKWCTPSAMPETRSHWRLMIMENSKRHEKLEITR